MYSKNGEIRGYKDLNFAKNDFITINISSRPGDTIGRVPVSKRTLTTIQYNWIFIQMILHENKC